jgi:hypothetical protein
MEHKNFKPLEKETSVQMLEYFKNHSTYLCKFLRRRRKIPFLNGISSHTLVVPKSFPSTKPCPNCGCLNSISLSALNEIVAMREREIFIQQITYLWSVRILSLWRKKPLRRCLSTLKLFTIFV